MGQQVQAEQMGVVHDVIRQLFAGDEEIRPDVLRMAQLLASFESAQYYTRNMNQAANLKSDLALLEHAFGLRPAEGLILEFGVASGRTTHKLASLTGERIHGFDVFTGLPETWRTGYPAGMFRQRCIPEMPDNVQLVPGLFEHTLPLFLEEHDGQASFVHVDCDLYKSTKTVFDLMRKRIRTGTVIVFDEYFNYPGWQQHEYLAFREFIAATGLTYDYIGLVSSHQQVAIRVT